MADQMDGKGRPPKRRSGLTRGQKGLIAAAAVLAVALAGVLAWQSLFVRPDLNTGKTEPQETEEPTDPVEEIDWGEGTRPRSDGERKSQDYYTVLILGRDTGGGGNTDTMLLASYDVTNQKATVMSIPRDTMVNVSWDIKKINSVYNWYGGGDRGIQYLYKEIAQLVGFEPDYQRPWARSWTLWAASGSMCPGTCITVTPCKTSISTRKRATACSRGTTPCRYCGSGTEPTATRTAIWAASRRSRHF